MLLPKGFNQSIIISPERSLAVSKNSQDNTWDKKATGYFEVYSKQINCMHA